VCAKVIVQVGFQGSISIRQPGTGTISQFGAMMRFNLASGFPLLTTKRVFWRGIVEELLWLVCVAVPGFIAGL
jgi:dihydrofolate reductase/thymidylate synthase